MFSSIFFFFILLCFRFATVAGRVGLGNFGRTLEKIRARTMPKIPATLDEFGEVLGSEHFKKRFGMTKTDPPLPFYRGN
jgi:hypothetical protein